MAKILTCPECASNDIDEKVDVDVTYCTCLECNHSWEENDK